jgi:carboxymethylenebutenolidase
MATSDGSTVVHDDVPLFVARPARPRGALVLLQEAFGVNLHIRDVAHLCADEGYLVAAPHLFHRQPIETFEYADVAAAKQALGEIRVAELISDVAAAVSWLRSSDGAPDVPVGTIGFCFGGRASFIAATAVDGLCASVAFYRAGIATDGDAAAPAHQAHRITCPVLALYGGRDPMIRSDEVGRVEAALSAAGVPHEVHVYPDADHGFFCDARPAVYDPASAADAWQRTLSFLTQACATGNRA